MFNSYKGMFTCTAIILIFLTACGNKEGGVSKNNLSSNHISAEKNSVSDNDLISDSVNTVIKVPDKEGNSQSISIAQKKVTIYTIDSESEQVVPKTGLMMSDEEFKPEAIVESVMLELDSLIDDDIKVNIEEKDASITVNFVVKDKKYPFGKKHPVSETAVLECISYSILDNFEAYKQVYFKLNGEAYISKQLKLSEEKPFMADE